jgi:hypothetical protein
MHHPRFGLESAHTTSRRAISLNSSKPLNRTPSERFRLAAVDQPVMRHPDSRFCDFATRFSLGKAERGRIMRVKAAFYSIIIKKGSLPAWDSLGNS